MSVSTLHAHVYIHHTPPHNLHTLLLKFRFFSLHLDGRWLPLYATPLLVFSFDIQECPIIFELFLWNWCHCTQEVDILVDISYTVNVPPGFQHTDVRINGMRIHKLLQIAWSFFFGHEISIQLEWVHMNYSCHDLLWVLTNKFLPNFQIFTSKKIKWRYVLTLNLFIITGGTQWSRQVSVRDVHTENYNTTLTTISGWWNKKCLWVDLCSLNRHDMYVCESTNVVQQPPTAGAAGHPPPFLAVTFTTTTSTGAIHHFSHSSIFAFIVNLGHIHTSPQPW